MADSLLSANHYVRQTPVTSRFGSDEIGNTLEPQPAIFAIPTHATTHAPGSSSEDQEETFNESLSDVRLQGRPAPTPDLNSEFDLTHRSHHIKAKKSDTRPSSSPSTSSHNTVTAQSVAHKPLPTKQSRPLVPRPSLRVDESHLSGLVADQTCEPPNYDVHNHPENFYEQQGGPLATAPGVGAPGRFPRWKGWLEKRALERHLERMDYAAIQGENALVQRKKSWGAGVDDENAVSDVEDQDENELPMPTRNELHLHELGSRFISHLPSLPLCSAFLDLPPAPQSTRTGQRLLRRSVPEGIKRKVLLIGTADGLYVAECRRRRKQDGISWSESLKRRGKIDGKRREDKGPSWNDNIRCRKVWSGMGVYQMSVLISKAADSEPRPSKYGFSFLSGPTPDVSIFLALCSTAKDGSKAQLVYSNAQATSSSFNTSGSTGVSTSKDNSTPYVATSHFGTGNGGGPSKVAPPGGSGTVRMWSLEALRRVVAHTLDVEEPRVIDLLNNRSTKLSSADKKSNLKMKLRKAWASLGEPSSDRKAKRASRQSTSLSLTTSPEVSPMVNEFRSKISAEPDSYSSLHRRSESQNSAGSDILDDFGQVLATTDTLEDGSHEESLRLAQDSVVLKLPRTSNLSSQQVNLGQGGSLTSLKSDESFGLGGVSNSGHGSSTNSHSSSGKGVLFFSVFEASSEVGTVGTWYLALATAKSIYLYEAPRPANAGESRTWVFVKEYYTPLSPKGIAFMYSEASETDDTSRSSTPLRKASHNHNQQSNLQATHQHQVKSSPYSSVFRSHSDLTLFVSFGKRAVLIRASDANVKEVDVAMLDSGDYASVSSEHGHGKLQQQNVTSAHKRRSQSADLLGGGVDGSGKEQWIGAEKVVSQVILRCKHHTPLDPPTLARSQSDHTTPTSRFDGEEDDDDDDDVYLGQGVTLRDAPVRTSSHGPQSLLRRESIVTAAAPTMVEPAHVLRAKLALLTKGASSCLYPLPLTWDLLQQRPLGVLTWSDIPTAVMAWSSVIGLERDLSSGPISISSLSASRRKVEMENMVHLHVKVTAVAFLASRIEMKRIRVKVQVKVPFVFNRDSELEIEPIAKEEESEEVAVDKVTAAEEEEEDTEREEAASVNQELEYLCGLLAVTSKGHDVMKPWESGGDAGAWAFDWRGADDFRLFYVSARM